MTLSSTIEMPSKPAWPLPTLTWVRLAIAPVLIFIATSMDRNYQTDFWHHLARGREIATEGKLLNVDLFTFTVGGKAFQDVNWLTQLVYYQLYTWGGLELVQFANSLVLACMMFLLVCLCWWSCKKPLLAAMMGVFTFFGLWQILLIRPQTVSLLLFVVLYMLLHLACKNRRALFLVPPILAMWANVHGAFPIGLILIAAFLPAHIWDRRHLKWQVLKNPTVRGWIICLFASFFATFVNPYGWNVYRYVSTTSSTATHRGIEEWLPPSTQVLIGIVLMISILLVMVCFAKSRRRPTALETSLIVCFLPFACSSMRMIGWWLIVISPVVCTLLATMIPKKSELKSQQPTMLAASFFVFLISFCVISLPWMDQYNPLMGTIRNAHRTESDLHAIATTLQQEPAGRIFSRFEWGEYFGWSLAPKNKVFMDGRIEIYPDSVWLQYCAITGGRADWEKILDQYHVNYLILDKSYHFDLLPLVEQSPLWKQVKQSGDAILFQRVS
jgi:hypothetical protein